MRTPILVLAGLVVLAIGGLVVYLLGGSEEDAPIEALRPETMAVGPDRAVTDAQLERPDAPTRETPVAEPVEAAPRTSPVINARVAQTDVAPTIRGRVSDLSGGGILAEIDVFTLGALGRIELGKAATSAAGDYKIVLDLSETPIDLTLEQELARTTRTIAPEVRQALEVLEQVERDARMRGDQSVLRRKTEGWFRDEPELGAAFRALRALRRGDEPAQIFVRATTQGYRTQTSVFALPDEVVWSRRIDFKLQEGGTLNGRVLHLGYAVPEASVMLFDQDFEEIGSTLTLADGTYSFGYREGGVYHVLARKETFGVTMHADLSLIPLVPMQVPDLNFGASEAVRGRVRNPDNTPGLGVAVEAIPLDFAIDETTTIPFDRLPQELLASALFHGYTRTNESGRFELSGLQPGRYRLRLPELRDRSLQPEVVVETGEDAVELVYGEPRLLIRVTGAGTDFEVFVTTLKDPTGNAFTQRRLTPARGRGGFVTCSVVQDATYKIVARTADGYEDSATVQIASERYLHSYTLRPERQAIRVQGAKDNENVNGRVKIVLTGDDGELARDVRALLVSTSSGKTVSDDKGPVDVGNRWVTLAPDDYLLELEHDYLIPQNDRAIRVSRAKSTTFRASAQLGGRVGLRITGAKSELPKIIDATLTFVRITSDPLRRDVLFVRQSDGTYESDPPLLPGPYVLSITLDDQALEEEGIAVRRGATTELAIDLE